MLLLMQIPLFWQGLRASHGRLDILQLEPIWVDTEHAGEKKWDDDCIP